MYICVVTPSWNKPLIYFLVPPGEAAKAPPACFQLWCSSPPRHLGPARNNRILQGHLQQEAADWWPPARRPRLTLLDDSWEKLQRWFILVVLFSNNAEVTGTRWGLCSEGFWTPRVQHEVAHWCGEMCNECWWKVYLLNPSSWPRDRGQWP